MRFGWAALLAVGTLLGVGVLHAAELAPEGRGLIAEPTPITPEAPSRARAFRVEPSGETAQVIFETSDSPDFNITVRDLSFAPSAGSHTITLPAAAILYLLSGSGEVQIANQSAILSPVATIGVPSGESINVINHGDYPLIIRTISVQSK